MYARHNPRQTASKLAPRTHRTFMYASFTVLAFPGLASSCDARKEAR